MRVVSPDTIACLTIWQEMRSEPFEDKVMVGEVIRTRAKKHVNCDGTIDGACLAPWQFSGWRSEDPNLLKSMRVDDSSSIWQECVKAWQESVGMNLAQGADHYYSFTDPSFSPPKWSLGHQPVARGLHTLFFKLR